jgi:transposase
MKPRQRQAKSRSAHWAAVHRQAAGIDSGVTEHWVAVPADHDPQPVRHFGACTADLEALAEWLTAGGVTTVAMESTGVYWIPLFAVLEARGFTVVLADAREGQRAPGRPRSDVHDGQWLQRLPTYGLLAAAFRPPAQVCVLRSSLRHRALLVTSASQPRQPLQKALTQRNVTRHPVVSNLTGVTGRAILKALLSGECDPAPLAQVRDRPCQHSATASARAWPGTWRAEPLFALPQAVEVSECYHHHMTQCADQIEAHLQTFADQSEAKPLPYRPRRRNRRATEPRFDARTPLFRLSGVDLTAIEGIEENTTLVLLSAIGTDLTRWPTEKPFASWLGLCPHHKISGGKVLSRKVRPSANRAATALRLAASCLPHSHSALGTFFRRLTARLGTPKALPATAHKLAPLVYRLRKHGEAYVAQGMAEYEQAYRERTLHHLLRKAKALGDKRLPTSDPTPQEELA